MADRDQNRVRSARLALGMSQAALAAATRLSRQSIGAIEAGRATPAVDVALRLAAALEASVEELFGAERREPPLVAEATSRSASERVALAQIAGRWLAYGLEGEAAWTAADGLLAPAAGARRSRSSRGSSLAIEPVRPLDELHQNVVLMGCAVGLGLLADRLSSRSGAGRFLWLGRSSTEALSALARRQTHLAGVHLTDEQTGEANVADVRRHLGREPVTLITFARWEAGLLLARGNPKQIRSGADLGRRELRCVVREAGSGARRLLERELQRAGLPRQLASEAPLRARGHLQVAQAIAMGAADVGVATRDAALAFGLHFLPLTEERYDLVVPRSALDDARVQRLLDTLNASGFQRELACLGYDVKTSGARVTELSAA